MRPVTLRLLAPTDSLQELTDLLHAAYAELAAAGMRFFATHQTVSDTAERAAQGECWVAVSGDRLVGTVTISPPEQTRGCAWYERPEVASFGQLGVDPAFRGQRIGHRLLELASARATAMGARELALDTAEGADRLIALYGSRGFRHVGTADWRPTTNYRSVVMSRALAPGAG